MKIAVFEPYTRTCGVTQWAFQIAHGFRDLGHECDVVSFTKSGRARATRGQSAATGNIRPGWRWWPDEPDVIGKWTDAKDILDKYDLIVLNEIKNGPEDTEAKKKHYSVPTYVRALQLTKTPWTSVMHDAMAYTPAVAPFIPALIATPTFTGVLVEARPGSYACAKWGLEDRVRLVQRWPWLPYKPKGRAPDVERHRIIGLGGRISSSKGFSTLASVAEELPERYQIHLFGPEAGGMGACVSFTYYEQLAGKMGWSGLRGDPSYISDKRSEWSLQINNYGAANTGHTWWLQKNGHVIKYTGPFLDGVEAWTKCAMAVQLSTDRIVTTLEYTTLEAMDAGCAMIVPRYYSSDMLGAEYDVHWLDKFNKGAKFSKTEGITWSDVTARVELVAAVNSTVERIESGGWDPGVNRAAIERYHAPRLLAGKILEVI